MKKYLFLYLSILLLTTVGFDSLSKNLTTQTAMNNFKEQLNQLIISEPHLKGAIVGISVRDTSTGKIVYQHNGDIRLRPASNLKLLTAATALSVLGGDYTFQTEVLTNGTIKGNTLIGDLFLKGKGDPTLLKRDLEKMAKKLSEMGIKTIKGNLVGDDTRYDDVRYSQDLPWTDEQTYYGAQVSALTIAPDKDYDAGTIIIEVEPGDSQNTPAKVSVFPQTHYVKIVNKTKTVPSNGKMELTYERSHGSNKIVIEGTIPVNVSKVKEWVAVWDPTNYALTLFKQSLAKNNINLKGGLETKAAPKDANKLITHKSISLNELLIPFMKLSNNGHAEILVKEMGKVVKGVGSWDKGLEVMEQELTELGLNANTLVIRDGSGISHVNLVPANEISRLLFEVQDYSWFSSFKKSLPVAGIEERMVGGSLRYRMEMPPMMGNVQAKTGTISTVSSLSGYVSTLSGKEYVFSILINNLLDEDYGKYIEDKIVKILANS